MGYDGVLKWWYPIPRSMLGTIRFKEGSNNAVTIDPWSSTTFDVNDALIVATGNDFAWDDWTIRLLLADIANAMSDAYSGGNEYFVEAASPASFAADTGIKWVRTSGSASFEIQWYDSGTTIDPRVMGWASDRPSVSSSSSGEIVAPYSHIGAIHLSADSPPLLDLRQEQDRLRFGSSMGPRYGFANEWVGDRQDTRVHHKRRRLRLRMLEAARVFPPRAKNSADATRAGIPEGDVNAQILTAWRWATLGPSWMDPQWDEVSSPLRLDQFRAEPLQWDRGEQINAFDQVVDDEDGDDHETYRASVRFHSGDPRAVAH
ncbi:MAG: hypothetical protein ABEN55_21735 [Bradymonadaceae bacterium]